MILFLSPLTASSKIFHNRTLVETRIEVERHVIRVLITLQKVQLEAIRALWNKTTDEYARASCNPARLNLWNSTTETTLQNKRKQMKFFSEEHDRRDKPCNDRVPGDRMEVEEPMEIQIQR